MDFWLKCFGFSFSFYCDKYDSWAPDKKASMKDGAPVTFVKSSETQVNNFEPCFRRF